MLSSGVLIYDPTTYLLFIKILLFKKNRNKLSDSIWEKKPQTKTKNNTTTTNTKSPKQTKTQNHRPNPHPQNLHNMKTGYLDSDVLFIPVTVYSVLMNSPRELAHARRHCSLWIEKKKRKKRKTFKTFRLSSYGAQLVLLSDYFLVL